MYCLTFAESDEASGTGLLRKKGVNVYKFADIAKMRAQTRPIIDHWSAKDRAIADLVRAAR